MLQSIASNERALASPPRHGNHERVNDQSATGTTEQIDVGADSGNREAMLRGLTELITALPDEFASQAENLLEVADSGNRRAMLRGLAELHARLPGQFAWQAEKLLERAGARKFVPKAGAVWDPSVALVVDIEPTSDVGISDTVARTPRPGWMDHDQVVVPALVVLYVVPDPRH
jgi:hypothetical protein